MHGAPSVSYPVGRSRFEGCLLAGAWLAGCGVGALWASYDPQPWRLAVLLIALVGAGSLAGTNWWFTPSGVLSWDGEGWRWSGCPTPALTALELGLDFQDVLLLRWVAPGASGWAWLSRADRPDRWDDLRRAVHSHPGYRRPVSGDLAEKP